MKNDYVIFLKVNAITINNFRCRRGHRHGHSQDVDMVKF